MFFFQNTGPASSDSGRSSSPGSRGDTGAVRTQGTICAAAEERRSVPALVLCSVRTQETKCTGATNALPPASEAQTCTVLPPIIISGQKNLCDKNVIKLNSSF